MSKRITGVKATHKDYYKIHLIVNYPNGVVCQLCGRNYNGPVSLRNHKKNQHNYTHKGSASPNLIKTE